MSRLRLWRHFDYVLLIIIILLTVFGVVMIYSANLGSPDPDLRDLWRRQAILGAVGIGVVLLLAAFPRDYHWYGDLWWLALLLAAVLLALVLQYGRSEVGQVSSWFNLGFFNLQPSFLAMNLLTIAVGSILTRSRVKRGASTPIYGKPKTSLTETSGDRPGLSNFVYSGAATFGLAALVFMQPDMGTALVFVAMWLAMVFEADVGLRYLVVTVLIGLASIFPLWQLVGALGFEYMQTRVMGFLDPTGNPDVVYQLEQATIAIGSGGLWGKGFAGGTQSQLRYLPVRHTDFIFAVLAEELGFAGVMLLFALYLLLFWRLLRVIVLAPDTYGRLIATGALALILFQIVINVGGNLGVLPVVGLPLPFLSYGPASLLTIMIAIGMAENVVMRRRKLEF
jgi:rod shape determining protein RodA